LSLSMLPVHDITSLISVLYNKILVAWNAPTQHQQRRWPDLKQILETPSTQA